MNDLGDLERRVAEHLRVVPQADLRARVLEAVDRAGRAETRAWLGIAAAAWAVALVSAWSPGAPEPAARGGRLAAVAERIRRGPDPALLPRLARPLGSWEGIAP